MSKPELQLLSPVQRFAALAARNGDIRRSFYLSGMKQALDAAFEIQHEKIYHDGDGLHIRPSHNSGPVPPHWQNTVDTVSYLNPLGDDSRAVFTLNRWGAVREPRVWRYWLLCEAAGCKSKGPQPGELFSVERSRRENGYQLRFGNFDAGATEFANVFYSLSILDRVLKAPETITPLASRFYP